MWLIPNIGTLFPKSSGDWTVISAFPSTERKATAGASPKWIQKTYLAFHQMPNEPGSAADDERDASREANNRIDAVLHEKL